MIIEVPGFGIFDTQDKSADETKAANDAWDEVKERHGGRVVDDNQKLAELLGWQWIKHHTPGGPEEGWWSPDGIEIEPKPKYDTDHNAMAAVYPVLEKRGLWTRFVNAYKHSSHITDEDWVESYKNKDTDGVMAYLNTVALYYFLNDLPGQVKAAIRVLEKE